LYDYKKGLGPVGDHWYFQTCPSAEFPVVYMDSQSLGMARTMDPLSGTSDVQNTHFGCVLDV